MKISKKDLDLKYVECCKEHEMVNYKTLKKLADKQLEEIKLLNQDIDNLQVRLGETIEQLVLNNKSWEQKYGRMAKLYIGFKRKYKTLFILRKEFDRQNEIRPFTEEEMKAAKDYTVKQKETLLESGRTRSQFFLNKRKKKNGKVK